MHSWWCLRRAARVVAAGGIIAYPTEAVFGLGCDPCNHDSLSRLQALKGRDARKGYIVIAATEAQLEDLVAFPDEAVRQRVRKTWPGPCTWVLPAKPGVNPLLSGARGTLAVRVTSHAVASALCALTGPLVSTSANYSGRPPARDALRVRSLFGAKLDYLVPGAVGSLLGPTEIRDGVTGKVLRPGGRLALS